MCHVLCNLSQISGILRQLGHMIRRIHLLILSLSIENHLTANEEQK